ncbi:MAG: diguanylate cyclase [Alphaproteobacteria bacterium]|nr:diguanylate cyclase [Alphaproteobacteria bacterium]
MATPTVRVVAGPDMLRFATLTSGERFAVGRDDTCGLILNDPSVSRNHAALSCDEHGVVSVQDLGSTNGTSINGRPVQRAQLRPGDHLEIGAVSLRLDLLDVDELAHLSRVLQALESADRDPLTGLLTRAWMQKDLPRLAERCEEGQLPLSLIFVDVDHFGRINNTFGHGVGDEVLRAISRLSLVGVRDTDAVLRYGGEELLVILPGSELDGAREVAERLRRTIRGHDWNRTGVGLKVTASFGVATRRPGEDVDAWIARADEAMYVSKRGGRNRVSVSE